MDRRETIKAFALGAAAPGFLLKNVADAHAQPRTGAVAFESAWHRWPDVRWAGPAYWGNRLQDWQIRDGTLECAVQGPNRSLHVLTRRLGQAAEPFEVTVAAQLLGQDSSSEGSYVGFRLGAEGPFPDYRSAAVHGEGLDAGVTTGGRLFIGEEQGADTVDTNQTVYLLLEATPQAEGYQVTLSALDEQGAQTLSSVTAQGVSNEALTGNLALVSHFETEREDAPAARFSRWAMQGPKLTRHPDAAFGPTCFAQYTLHRGTLKLTAQLAPIEKIEGHEVALEIKEGNQWQTLGTRTADPLARVARFRAEQWARDRAVPYRLRVSLPLRDGQQDFFYEGTIAREPNEADQLKAAVFSCNTDYGFPNADVVYHVNKHRPDMALFLGDQYYERDGGFGVQRAPLNEACLDFLRKWYMFGWSYRDLFRDIPAAFIPDDHDVYHGNIWGEGGDDIPVEELGWGSEAQDVGGYKMPPRWVNAVQQAQTSHLPDPYDPTPVEQDIGVYYTDWTYGGVSFAILEDRKFKSAPKNILPERAQVDNGYITNLDFDLSAHRDWPDAHLLGERQMAFLSSWVEDWGDGVAMKVVLSQTNFCTAHTLPEGSTSGSIIPELPLPAPGEYVAGDAPSPDMDPNGWPQNRRDETLRLLRKAFAFHVAGDQHLSTVLQYGVDDFDDAAFAFTAPALNNIWPRRWWPDPSQKQHALPARPAYTGAFFDALGNRLTMHAAANPRQTGLEPSIIYDRVTGYGIVVFDKRERTIRMECWPRHVDPEQDPEGQYEGWPVVIDQRDNDGRSGEAWLPEIDVAGLEQPVLQVVDEAGGEVVYTLRLQGQQHQPVVFREGSYTVNVGDGTRWLRSIEGLAAHKEKEGADAIRIDVRQ